jgi:hypothetical protein
MNEQTEAAKTKTCPMCGEVILAAAIRCEHCGSSLGVGEVLPQSASSAAKRGRGRLIAIAGVVAVIVAAGALSIAPFTRRLVFREFMAGIQDHRAACEAARIEPVPLQQGFNGPTITITLSDKQAKACDALATRAEAIARGVYEGSGEVWKLENSPSFIEAVRRVIGKKASPSGSAADARRVARTMVQHFIADQVRGGSKLLDLSEVEADQLIQIALRVSAAQSN